MRSGAMAEDSAEAATVEQMENAERERLKLSRDVTSGKTRLLEATGRSNERNRQVDRRRRTVEKTGRACTPPKQACRWSPDQTLNG